MKKYLFSFLSTYLAIVPVSSQAQTTLESFFTDTSERSEKGYIIQFDNVNIVQYIKFISKISNKNFIFDEAELNFAITLVSDEPTSMDEIMAALVQSLRIHGFSLVEQGNNLIIHQAEEVKTPPHTIDSDTELSSPNADTFITKVFKLDNINPDQILTVLESMLSGAAIIEAVPETKNIVISDTTENIKRVTELIQVLDTPKGAFEVATYIPRYHSISSLTNLSMQILERLKGNHPLQMVPQVSTNTIFIISTPYLNRQAIATLESLDRPSLRAQEQARERELLSEQEREFFLQQTSMTADELDQLVKEVAKEAEAQKKVEEKQAIEEAEAKTTVEPFFDIAAEQRETLTPEQRSTLLTILSRDAAIATTSEKEQLGQIGQGRLTEEQRNALAILIAGEEPLDSTSKSTLINLIQEEEEEEILQRAVTLSIPAFEEEIEQPVIITEPPQDEPDDSLRRLLRERSARLSAPDFEVSRFVKEDLPPDDIESTTFYIHKLEYRKGEELEIALKSIASVMEEAPNPNRELLNTVRSAKWIQTSNALVFSGSPRAIERVTELIRTIDVPLRQVFIEILLIRTSLRDALTFGVEWAAKFRDTSNNYAASAGFVPNGPTLFDTSFQSIHDPSVVGTDLPAGADASTLFKPGGALGIVGRILKHNNEVFLDLSSLAQALEEETENEILLHPKILTEDNNQASLFVGGTFPYKTGEVRSQEGGNLVETIEYRDVGHTISITPILGNTDVVTLEISQSYAQRGTESTTQDEVINLLAPTEETSTTTRVHVPNNYFLVLSGNIEEERDMVRSKIPCLGDMPSIFGYMFKREQPTYSKRNMIMFIRPHILETAEEMENLTHYQHNEFIDANGGRPRLRYHIDRNKYYKNPNPE